MKVDAVRALPWREWRTWPSVWVAALGVVLPLLVVAQPLQPVRALAALIVLAVLPGLALARLLDPRDPVLVALVTVAASLAMSVLVSTGLVYAGIWSWQLTLAVLGMLTVAASLLRARRETP